MANNSFADYSTTPALNTDIAGTSIAVGCPPADVGIYARTLLAQIAYNVQGTPGLFTPTWHVGTLTATTANVTTVNASSPGISGTQVVNFSQFNPNTTTTGSCLLPGGLILNWGVSTTPGGGALAVGFNRSYASACFAVIATTFTTSPASTVSAAIASVGSFNAATYQSGVLTGAVTFYWMAIGL